MQPEWFTRLVQEHDELEDRLQSLIVFCTSDAINALAAEDANLLRQQRAAMSRYLRILTKRIERGF